jgi:hypothetical protein
MSSWDKNRWQLRADKKPKMESSIQQTQSGLYKEPKQQEQVKELVLQPEALMAD